MTDLRNEFDSAIWELNMAYNGYDSGCYNYEDLWISDLQKKIDTIIETVKKSDNTDLMKYINNEIKNNYNLSYIR